MNQVKSICVSRIFSELRGSSVLDSHLLSIEERRKKKEKKQQKKLQPGEESNLRPLIHITSAMIFTPSGSIALVMRTRGRGFESRPGRIFFRCIFFFILSFNSDTVNVHTSISSYPSISAERTLI